MIAETPEGTLLPPYIPRDFRCRECTCKRWLGRGVFACKPCEQVISKEELDDYAPVWCPFRVGETPESWARDKRWLGLEEAAMLAHTTAHKILRAIRHHGLWAERHRLAHKRTPERAAYRIRRIWLDDWMAKASGVR